MPKKYRFRKVYFICIDKQVIKPSDRVETFYKFRADAEAEANNQLSNYRPYQINNPSYKLPNIGAEGFFLVHESLYEEILKAFDRVELKVIK